MWTARQIEVGRLREIIAILRLTVANRGPAINPSEWTGWQTFSPDRDRDRYHAHAAAGLCARCGNAPPRPGRKTCARCAEDQRARSAALRAKRKAAGACVDCGAPSGPNTRCVECLKSYRGPGRWARKRRLSARHEDYSLPVEVV